MPDWLVRSYSPAFDPRVNGGRSKQGGFPWRIRRRAIPFTPMWDERREQYLRDNWLRTAASQIAADLGVTRNAVIGKAHRLRLPATTPSTLRKSARARTAALIPPPPPPKAERPVSLPGVKKRHQKPSRILADAPQTVDFHHRKRHPRPACQVVVLEVELDEADMVIAARIGEYPISPAIARAARGFLAYRARLSRSHHHGRG